MADHNDDRGNDHAYDGGVYAELICNRAFLDDTNAPAHWLVVAGSGAEAGIALDTAQPYNDALTASLRLTVTKASKAQPAGVANSGYWGIPVQPRTRYRASLLARAGGNFAGPVTVSIVSDDGQTVYAAKKFSGLTTDWKKFELTLKTGNVPPATAARFEITFDQPGTVWFGMVSLFPPTWNNQPNGFRKDLMQMLVDLNPKFLRFPGRQLSWKATLSKGGLIGRKPSARSNNATAMPCPWGYRSTDGLGLLEFLQWCEDMKAEPVLAVYAGYSLGRRARQSRS